MMADDTSSPSSTTKTQAEEANEETKSHNAEPETTEIKAETHKLTNGHIVQEKEPKEEPLVQLSEDEHNNNEHPDSLEVDNNNEVYVEEKTYTSQLETCLVVKEVTEKTIHKDTLSDETLTTDQGDGQTVMEESTSEQLPNEILVPEQIIPEQASPEQAVPDKVIPELLSEEVKTTPSEKEHEELDIPMESLEIPSDEEGDGFVAVADCLPPKVLEDDGTLVDVSLTGVEQHKEVPINGYGETNGSSSTPEPQVEEKVNHPDIEEFVKSGGVKRILPGVQKTEQPYSSCTTETKIAMEIREMREREEELRIMREQSLLSPVISPVPPKSPSPAPSLKDSASPTPPPGPGYRVSSVFGQRVSPAPADDERRLFKMTAKESAVEKEIRLARDREEELRKEKGLPPREDDSYVKPSQVKSSQVRIFGKAASSVNVKHAATAKIQMEIEEQTQREMALRETGSIQTISQERTDAKVAKLDNPPSATNGNSTINGSYSNGHHSPDITAYKRTSLSPTDLAGRPASIFSQSNGKSSVNMQKFIANKGKKDEKVAVVPPTMVKLKRTVSVESKIQQEIMEMKQREEELKKLHMKMNNESLNGNEDYEMNRKNSFADYESDIINEEDLSPRHNKLIAQWEQRIQKAES